MPARVPAFQIRPGVSGVVFRADGRVLLQQRADNGLWGIPGGAVEYGESVLAALRREIAEETGLAVEIGRLIGVYSDPAIHQIITYPDGNAIHFVSVCFECRPTTGLLALSDETVGLAWFSPRALPPTLMPVHRIRIEDALASAPTPFVR